MQTHARIRRMDELIKNVRKENLLLLLSGFKGREKEFAQRVDLEPSYLSRIKGSQPIGGKVARQIEHAMGKPYLWLDREHGAEELAIENKGSVLRQNVADYHVDSLLDELIKLIKEMPESKKVALLELLKK